MSEIVENGDNQELDFIDDVDRHSNTTTESDHLEDSSDADAGTNELEDGELTDTDTEGQHQDNLKDKKASTAEQKSYLLPLPPPFPLEKKDRTVHKQRSRRHHSYNNEPLQTRSIPDVKHKRHYTQYDYHTQGNADGQNYFSKRKYYRNDTYGNNGNGHSKYRHAQYGRNRNQNEIKRRYYSPYKSNCDFYEQHGYNKLWRKKQYFGKRCSANSSTNNYRVWRNNTCDKCCMHQQLQRNNSLKYPVPKSWKHSIRYAPPGKMNYYYN